MPGVGGTWKDLTDNVNLMATNLTNQVRGIAEVVTAVAQGNLRRKLTLDAKGEIAALAETINFMIETLSTFGDQVTNMAREVGIEGRLGGQARVPGAAGLWRDLTDNVNQLAANLTNQVRSIAEVATAVTKGDLTRSIAVEAQGEMAALKDNINEMIRNLKDQTLKNAEQDWLKTNLARFSRMLQGERDLATVSNLIMSELAPLVNAQYGVFYVTQREEEETKLELVASYGAESPDELKREFKLREGLIGQAAADKRPILLKDVPPDFLRVGSGLGQAAPANVNILPALFEDEVRAVIELASFSEFNETHQSFLNQLMESVGIVLNTIAATMRTEGLLKQSQLLTQELQARQTELTTKQEELHNTNEELQEKAQLLENEKKQVEAKNLEIDMARRAIEEKAEQLALTSKYKSEFLANMSHELRTPLNSLLILSKLLADNPQGNLNEKQTEFARTIHSARLRSAEPDQRHPRSVEDRIRHRLDRDRRDADAHLEAAHGADLPPAGAPTRSSTSRSSSIPSCRRRSAPTKSGSSRSSSTCCPTPSNSPRAAASPCRSRARPAAGARATRCCATPTRRSRLPSPTPASAFPRTSRS